MAFHRKKALTLHKMKSVNHQSYQSIVFELFELRTIVGDLFGLNSNDKIYK